MEPSPLLLRLLLAYWTNTGWSMMMDMEQSVECLAGEIEVLGGNLPQSRFVHHISTWPDPDSNPDRRCGQPATIVWATARPYQLLMPPFIWNSKAWNQSSAPSRQLWFSTHKVSCNIRSYVYYYSSIPNVIFFCWKDPIYLRSVIIHSRSGGPGSIPDTTRKKSSGSGTGSTQPREYNWGATW
jgi:hypothetical protein